MGDYMEGRHAPKGSPAHRLYLWIECLYEIMTRFYDQFNDEVWIHEYSARSLPELEESMLDFCSYDDGSDMSAMYLESAAAYLGETLIEEAGGRWDWDENAGTDGLPVVCPDPVLGLEPVVPLLVVGQALNEKTGKVFATVARLLRKAVRDRQRQHPEWWPKRVPTPWVGYGTILTACNTAREWRNDRMIDFLHWWAAEAGGRRRWKYTPASLDAMQALLRENFRTVEDYDQVAHEPFWTMAAWYVGQYVVEIKDALWQYREINPDAPPGTWHAEDCYWTGSVFVNQRLRYDGHAEHPWKMLRDVIAGESLREVVDRFPDPVLPGRRTDGTTWPEALWVLARPEHLETPSLPPLAEEELKKLEEADDLEGPDWADNHRLNTWLAERREAFPAWAEEAGGGTAAWDFSPESLDRLEGLVRGRFSTYEEMVAAEDDPFLAGAAWYFGEVQVRQCGAAWKCRPEPSDDTDVPDDPLVTAPEPDPEDDDGDDDPGWDDDDYVHLCVPASELRALLLRGPDERLRNALEAYAR
ncbi:hypothetical protein [Streptomyces sp. ME19-01-6]|uniref:hypothetical protein n=1 Tax=Streptomyces sp. ME19-01-6 TaxID=3028686 RepID=UPI0029B33DE0|nr:hypothetical protein [Streptomyces sp. ME19-01-6]MDX3233390.1 hypothetical protein [Streptomyces sp. ME19-01-6]